MSFLKKLVGGVVGGLFGGGGGGGSAPAAAAPARRTFVPPTRAASSPQLDRIAAMRARFSRMPQTQSPVAAPAATAPPVATATPAAAPSVAVKAVPNPVDDDLAAYARNWDHNNG